MFIKMIGFAVEHRIYTGLLLMAAVIAFAVLSLWLTGSWSNPASAQERMANACAEAVYPDSFDVSLRTSADYGTGTTEVVTGVYRKNSNAEYYLFSDEDGNPTQEAVMLYRLSEDSGGRSPDDDGGIADLDPAQLSPGDSVTMQSFLRQHESDDWGEWAVADHELPSSADASADANASTGVRSADGSTGASGAATNDADQFCGLPLELEGHDVILRHEGEETIDGVTTDHFFYSYSPVGVDGYKSMEYWIDRDGLFRKVRLVFHIPASQGESGETVEWVKYYSGWGEHNAIAPPVPLSRS